ncbi:Holliday junction DNA helicase RuvB C-terminal domain-containing protein [Thalassoroseus pseudoceratinae]|uniref:Holliday junction DNA helicase RuvB C-terminal domain-containing protein n=1 Tax=Thalassoroseus pseudoceratinae TaxID=2713176 RepID=UPI001420FF00|nr:Holliday junction DNA helicase RuvB C-terminal domain-containing protein [Thalassoroseus pseudoceratinae]
MDSVVPSLSKTIGQNEAVSVLTTAVDAYFYERSKRGDKVAFPHTLITGAGGLGKSFLADLIGRECCTTVHHELAQNVRTPEHVRASLMMLDAGSVLYYDEIHELPPTCAVTLYSALQDGELHLGKHHVLKLPPFCLVGATTHEFLLAPSCRQRFRLLLRLQFYSDDEMARILRQRATILGWHVEDEAINSIASRSRGIPRLGVRWLEAAKRTASANYTDEIKAEHVEQTFAQMNVDSLGFDAIEQRYLQLLREGQGPVRLNVLATHLGLPRQSIEMFEADFIRLGLITKSDKGRVLTAKGVEHLASSVHVS